MNSPTTALIDTEAGFRQAIDTVIAAATDEIRIFDRNLTRVVIDRKDVAESLERFFSGGRHRRLHVVVHDPDHCERYQPRVQALLRRFSLAIEIRQSPDELRHLQECYLLADSLQAALRFNLNQPRGKIILEDREAIRPWWTRFDDLWQLSTPCLGPSRLGL